MISLCDGASSSNIADLVKVGLIVERLVEPGVTLARRVQSVEFIAHNVTEKATSVDLDLRPAKQLAAELGMPLDCTLVSLLPKSLMYRFDLRDESGGSVSAIRRTLDSRFAQCFLVTKAMSRESGYPGLPPPSDKVWRLVYEHCFKFSIEFDPYLNLAHALEIGHSLEGDDSIWWAAACSSDAWREWLLRLGDLFCLTVRLAPDDDRDYRLLKFVRRGGSDPIPNPNVASDIALPASPNRKVAIRLYDLGHARSEHIHLRAPRGVFLSDGFLVTRGVPTGRGSSSTVLSYRRRASRHEVVLYSESVKLGNCLVLANLWPETRGFVSPLRYIAYYFATISIAAGILGLFVSIQDKLSGNSDAAVALIYLLPSIAIGYLFQAEDQHDIRWRMLRWSRFAALVLVGCSMIVSFSWLIKVGDFGRTVVTIVDLSMGLVALAVAIVIEIRIRAIFRADATGARSEVRAPRGQREFITVHQKSL